jgi:hypothetical protein
VSFPSRRGERSCVFTKNQYFVCHLFPPELKAPRGVNTSRKMLSGTGDHVYNGTELTIFSIGVNDLELTTTLRAGSYTWFQRVLIRELPDDASRFPNQK